VRSILAFLASQRSAQARQHAVPCAINLPLAARWHARGMLLPVPYYHVVFTLPARIADIAYQNKAVVYDLLFKASSETMLTIAADPKHLGARIGTILLGPLDTDYRPIELTLAGPVRAWDFFRAAGADSPH
jgi:hypothetical protein